MPHRVFTLAEVAEYLHLAAGDVERLAREGEIPAERSGAKLVFRRNEIDAWASQRLLEPRRRSLGDFHKKSSTDVKDLARRSAIFPELMTESCVKPALSAKTKASVLSEMVRVAEATGLLLQPGDLLSSLRDREELCSTAMAGGIALLHPRHHDPYMFEKSFIVLGRTLHPVPFGAPDGGLTDLFFLICCEDDALHLHTLARVCAICVREKLLEELRAAESAEAMLDLIIQAEHEVIRGL